MRLGIHFDFQEAVNKIQLLFEAMIYHLCFYVTHCLFALFSDTKLDAMVLQFQASRFSPLPCKRTISCEKKYVPEGP